MFSSFTFFSQEKKDSIFVHFDYNKSSLESSEIQKINRFVETFIQDSILNIFIEGHCDNSGTDEHNHKLSAFRTNTVSDILLQRINKTNLISNSFGETKPIASNETEQGKVQNRRVLIVCNHIEKLAEPAIVTPIVSADTSKKEVKINGEKIEIGKNIVIKDLNFIGGRHTLVQTSEYALEKLLSVMKDNPTLEIEIQGHICCSPPDEDGWDSDSQDNNLSVNRAKAIYDYLVDHGIDSNRMSYKGMIARFPLVKPELTESDRNKNRRVEVKILKY
ncbi:MAG: hypothetical protein A2236_01405 [Bacteroidetes bacterium RIFOXYA2_FULL_33_7]|nr:MAG: hypothetical protein A2236_01405 [Bacteroidetes bacterium RIFOXYA2_FULL_33_7]